MASRERLQGEKEVVAYLENEVLAAASLSDTDRIRILRDLLRTVDAIRRCKSPEEIEREDEVRSVLNDRPGRERYMALAESFEGAEWASSR